MASQAEQVSGEISALGSWDPGDPQDLHDHVSSLHQVGGATAAMYRQAARTIEGTGLDRNYVDALDEAASSIDSIIEELQQRIGGGAMRRGG